MFIHPQFDPIALQLGPLAIRWYGLMYLLAFGLFIFLGRMQLRRRHIAAQGWTARDIDDLLFAGVIGVILGGRLGYILFYKLGHYLENPLDILKVWEGGMSFHGGFLGVLVAMAWFGSRRGKTFFQVTDFIAPLIPAGLAAGRFGNFLNGELWGRPTDGPWGMVFPQAGDMLARHPSQLYQFALEGLALFALLWWYGRKPHPVAAMSGLFLLGYGLFRFIAEFAREPDNFLGLLALGLSMGQWLSLPMIVAGLVFLVGAHRKQAGAAEASP